jgi:hypothetical protein
MKRNTSTAVLLALSILLPGSALAREHGHNAGPQSSGDRAASMMMHGGMSGMCPMMAMANHPEGSLAFLKVELAITPSQTTKWDVFASAYRSSKHGMESHQGSGPNGRDESGQTVQPLPKRIDRHVKMMEGHLHELERLQAPIEDLYASLGDDQKRTADELLPMFVMCGML